jgi:hypothetical protein
MPLANENTYHQEASGWLKILDSLQQENVRLKNRIADVIRMDVDGNMLDQAELMLSSIINKEAVISLLRRDIVQHLKDIQPGSAIQKHTNLKEDIGKMQQELQRLTVDLTSYIETSVRV